MYEEISKNNRNSIILIVVFVLFVLFLGWLFGELLFGGLGFVGIIIAGILATIFAFFGYFYSDKIVLSISGAREVKKEEFPYLYNLIDNLATGAGIPKPKAYVINDTALNAFATGRNPEHSVIVVTTGILQKLDRSELEGVIAHEMSHIKNYDIRLMTLTVVFVGIVVLLSDILLRSFLWGGVGRNREANRFTIVLVIVGVLLAILSPIIATLIKLAISREREYLADASGAMLTRNPEGLASALEKISGDKEVLEAANSATAHLYISNPLKGTRGWFDGMFSTHPPVEKRIARLRQM